MKVHFLVYIIVLGCLCGQANAFFQKVLDKGIYGDDNRRLITELSPEDNAIEIAQARSVFAQIPKWRITSEDDRSISIKTKNLTDGINFCKDEKFSELPVVSSCTAFLVGPDLILTAGHCLKDSTDCQKNVWVLDYDDSKEFKVSDDNVSFSKDKILKCLEIVSSSNDSDLDYALVRIDKKIVDREALKLRTHWSIHNTDSMLVIGHPFGLPKIMADDVLVRDNSGKNSFTVNADTFSGNSGSPVINSKTHLVEGILIKGGRDFSMDMDTGCNRAFHCSNDGCSGETVQRSKVLPLKFIP